MTQKTIKSLVFIFAAALFVLGGCEKSEELITKQEITKKTDNNKAIYIVDNEVISIESLDKKNEEIMFIHGYAKNKNEILVFTSRDDFYCWAEKTNQKTCSQLVEAIKNADKARTYAEKIGEFNKEQTSADFLNYLEKNFSSQSKIGLGKLTEGYDLGGSWSYLLGSVPIARFKYRNQASCIQPFLRWYVLYDKTYWRGWLDIFVGTGNEYFNLPASSNNKTESIWTI
jgi:hypothetical protein